VYSALTLVNFTDFAYFCITEIAWFSFALLIVPLFASGKSRLFRQAAKRRQNREESDEVRADSTCKPIQKSAIHFKRC
jgi:hypothetical protein